MGPPWGALVLCPDFLIGAIIPDGLEAQIEFLANTGLATSEPKMRFWKQRVNSDRVDRFIGGHVGLGNPHENALVRNNHIR